MRSIFALALIFGTTFAGANTLLAQQNYQALSKDALQTKIESSAYASKASVTPVRAIRLVAHVAVNG